MQRKQAPLRWQNGQQGNCPLVVQLTYAQKKAVFFDQFHAVGLTMYGVSTLHAMPTTLLRPTVSTAPKHNFVVLTMRSDPKRQS